MKIEKKGWGEDAGDVIWLYSIKSECISIDITNYGCTIVAIRIKGKNVILGYSSFEELKADEYYMGSIVGRFAGRISKSSFEIDGNQYVLAANDGASGTHLHGGHVGFNRMVFREISMHSGEKDASITFRGTSEDLDQGYPGRVEITFTITLTADNKIKLDYLVVPDRPTHINLTHHLYYNLCGPQPGTAQHLAINANSIVEAGEDYIPTGRIVPIPAHANFLISRKIPDEISYNECYVLNQTQGIEVAAELSDRSSGGTAATAVAGGIDIIYETGMNGVTGMTGVTEVTAVPGMPDVPRLTMELSTTCPGLIFYSGQFLGPPFYPKQGICLEAQYFPDSPNQKDFPSTLYSQDKSFREQTTLHFKNII
jgi:aldose 1-epimerase